MKKQIDIKNIQTTNQEIYAGGLFQYVEHQSPQFLSNNYQVETKLLILIDSFEDTDEELVIHAFVISIILDKGKNLTNGQSITISNKKDSNPLRWIISDMSNILSKENNLKTQPRFCQGSYRTIEKKFLEDFGIELLPTMKSENKLVAADKRGTKLCDSNFRFQFETLTINCSACKYAKIYTPQYLVVDLPSADLTIPLVAMEMNKFLKRTHPYYALGYYGYGINNNAFYYIRRDDWRTIYFRLQLGGVYSSSHKDSIGDFLKRFEDFQNKIQGKVEHLKAIQMLSNGDYSITINGKEHTQQLKVFEGLDGIDFGEMFGEVL